MGARLMAVRNTEPAEARTTFGFHWLATAGVAITLMPNASAERIRVPTFPGS